ncbi:hypothetical protein EI94DRAFT_1730725, partial [Lactarius quietus]
PDGVILLCVGVLVPMKSCECLGVSWTHTRWFRRKFMAPAGHHKACSLSSFDSECSLDRNRINERMGCGNYQPDAQARCTNGCREDGFGVYKPSHATRSSES